MPNDSQHFETTRSDKDRRKAAGTVEECRLHEARLDAMSNSVSKQSGWLKVGSGVLTFGMFILGIMCTNIISGQSRLEGMLSEYKVAMAKVEKDVDSLKTDMRRVEERNKYIDQQNGMYNYNTKHNTGTTVNNGVVK